MRIPRPSTKRAYLVSAGYAQVTATMHRYRDTRRVTLPGPNGEAYEHVFVCEETGIERRWGTTSIPEDEIN